MNSDLKEALRHRIRECARILGSGDELARRSGVPRRTLESYLSGRSEPKATGLALIAEAAGVSLDWLVLGRQVTPSAVADSVVAPIDAKVLADVIRFIEDWLNENGRTLEPGRKADIITLSYELAMVTAAVSAPGAALEKVARLLRLTL